MPVTDMADQWFHFLSRIAPILQMR